ncbi:MAG TPA: hypothetical protein VMJ74_04735, partial [Pseudomonadales bacterium]|nr:hypothetical protein [Pseudomonadales bacterium]
MIGSAWRARLGACVAAVASAIAIALFARERWPWAGLCWIALVPWLATLDRTTSWKSALAAGIVMSEAFTLIVFAWFPSAVQNYTAIPWPFALLLVAVVAPLLEPQFVTFAVARWFARRRGVGWSVAALVAASVYVGSEWALPKLFADTLGQGLYASVWMRQAADVAGAHGLTFVLIIASECALAALRGSIAV